MDKRIVLRCALPVLAILAATPVRAEEPPPFTTWTYDETSMGLYLPRTGGKPLPVVMFLHPCHNDPLYEGLWINQALNDIEPTAVFLPTAPPTPNTPYDCADWGGTYDVDRRPQMENALHEYDSLVRAHGFDTTRQYLYGESMGGEGVYRLLVDFPQRFAGAVSVGGYTKNNGAAQMAQTPFWILIGDQDEMSPIDETRAIRESILAAGGTQLQYTELPGLGHVAAIEQVRTDTSVVRWLLRQRRATASIRPDLSRTSRSDVVLNIEGGSIRLSESLPPQTRLSFYGTDGTLLLQTDARTRTVRIPSNLRQRVVFWKASYAGETWSGKVALVP